MNNLGNSIGGSVGGSKVCSIWNSIGFNIVSI